MNLFTRYCLALMSTALAAVCLPGCVGDDGSDAGGGNNRCGADGGAGSCRTTAIGGRTWLAENLNRETGGSWCYENQSSNCDKYGRLYDWNAAMSACPSGWRLPKAEDWGSLVAAAGGKDSAGRKLKSANGWYSGGNGTDDLRFSALPGGYRGAAGSFYHAGDYGIWWTADEESVKDAWYRAIDYGKDYVIGAYHDKSYGRSVRCVRN
ncbi:hypothetical protein R80B4_02396 [Fibrobacteres bacterium R8-0-B4]